MENWPVKFERITKNLWKLDQRKMFSDGFKDMKADEIIMLSWISDCFYNNHTRDKQNDFICKSIGKRGDKYYWFNFKLYLTCHPILFTGKYSTDRQRIARTIDSLVKKGLLFKHSEKNENQHNMVYVKATDECKRYFYFINNGKA